MAILQKSTAFLRLIRPELPIAAGVCVVLGQIVALGRLPSFPIALLGFLLGLFLSGSQMVFNDYFDLEVDRVNAPHRPYAAGLLSRAEVIAFGVALALIALVVALFIHPVAFALCLVAWVLGFLYNWKLKSAGLWGNLIVATSVGMTFIIGGVSVGRVSSLLLWVFALIAFVFDLAEEIAGDAMDIAGDRQRGSRSIAIRHGRRVALRVSSLLFVVMIALTVVPVVMGETGLGYLVPIAFTDLLIAFFACRLFNTPTPRQGHGWMRGLYLSASIGLVAAIAGMLLFG